MLSSALPCVITLSAWLSSKVCFPQEPVSKSSQRRMLTGGAGKQAAILLQPQHSSLCISKSLRCTMALEGFLSLFQILLRCSQPAGMPRCVLCILPIYNHTWNGGEPAEALLIVHRAELDPSPTHTPAKPLLPPGPHLLWHTLKMHRHTREKSVRTRWHQVKSSIKAPRRVCSNPAASSWAWHPSYQQHSDTRQAGEGTTGPGWQNTLQLERQRGWRFALNGPGPGQAELCLHKALEWISV